MAVQHKDETVTLGVQASPALAFISMDYVHKVLGCICGRKLPNYRPSCKSASGHVPLLPSCQLLVATLQLAHLCTLLQR